jgi:hypothetical protein
MAKIIELTQLLQTLADKGFTEIILTNPETKEQERIDISFLQSCVVEVVRDEELSPEVRVLVNELRSLLSK